MRADPTATAELSTVTTELNTVEVPTITAELSIVTARPSAMQIVREHARLRGCEVAVFGPGGETLFAEGELRAARPSGASGTVRADGVRGPHSVAAVVAFERILGYVVARGDDGSQSVADNGAAILGELAAREYELNDLSREILVSYEELNLFYDLASELAGAQDADAICRMVFAKACRAIPSRSAWILLADGPHGTLRVAVSNVESRVGMNVSASSGLAGDALANRAVELVEDVRHHDQSKLSELERAAERSIVTVALSVPGRDDRAPVGVLQLCDKEGGAPFTAGDLKLAQAIASQAAVFIQNSRLIGLERELKIARTIQQSLLPGAPPSIDGLDVAGIYTPASNVGGDYYDHLQAGESSLAFLVADVSGHNLAAALLQTAARAAFRAAAFADPTPRVVMERAARTLHDDLSRAELFLTAWFGCVDAATGVLAFCDAGHNAALLVRAGTREVVRLATGGIPIGVDDDSEFDEGRVTLAAGDVVLAYTDGVVEANAPNDPSNQYGEDRLAAALIEAAHEGAASIVRAIQEDVARFSGDRPAGDDRSLVVLKFAGR